MAADREIRVRVPASSANLGPGFDTLAVALGLYLRCTLRPSSKGLRITAAGVDAAEIPCDQSNLIWRTFSRLAGPTASDVELEIDNAIPLGKGLGSSAAAIVAGFALVDLWMQGNRSKQRLIELSTGVEGHPDNVAAAALGGLVASCQTEDGRVLAVKCRFPEQVKILLVVPSLRLSTEAARAALPMQYARRDVVFNLQRVALLLAAFQNDSVELLRDATHDALHQAYRAPLIPGLKEILKLENVPGLLGIALSGAGPSVLAFCSGETEAIGQTILELFRTKGIGAEAIPLAVDVAGLAVEA